MRGVKTGGISLLLALALAVAFPAALYAQSYQQYKTSRFNVETADSYHHAAVSGIMAAALAADSEIYQFRWTSTTHRAVISAVHFSAANNGTAFAAGSSVFRARAARAWTVAGTGGTVVTPADHSNKNHVAMATARVTEIRVASTAALGAGTKTLDAQNVAALVSGVTVSAGAVIAPIQDMLSPHTTYPLILSADEGFVIHATVPATGTWKFHVEVEWFEIPIDQVR